MRRDINIKDPAEKEIGEYRWEKSYRNECDKEFWVLGYYAGIETRYELDDPAIRAISIVADRINESEKQHETKIVLKQVEAFVDGFMRGYNYIFYLA